MKKLLSFILILSIILSIGVFGFNVSADTEGYYTYNVYKGEAYIIDVTEHISGSITVPSTLGGYPVTRIAGRGFSDCMGITSVTIPDNVTAIGIGAFYGCSNLQNIIIPDSVEHIGEHAFSHCSGLSNITIPGSISNIQMSAFYDSGLESVTISEGVTNIGRCTFGNCENLSSITLPKSLRAIDQSAFSMCTSLNNVYYNSTADDWVNISFYNGSSNPIYYAKNIYFNDEFVTNVVLSQNVTYISDYSFYGSDTVTNVVIPNSVTSIGLRVFSDCTNLASVTIPESVTEIDSFAFYNCKDLIIYGYLGSYAETFANKNGYAFISLETGKIISSSKIENNIIELTAFNKTAFLECNIDFFNLDDASLNLCLNDVKIKTHSLEETFSKSTQLSSEKYKGKTVTLSCDGYKDYVIPADVLDSWFESDDPVSAKIYMEKDKKDGKAYLTGAYARYDGIYTDIQTESLTALADTTYDIILTAKGNGSTISQYVISQDDAHKITSTTGVFSSQALCETFEAGADIYAYVKTSSGETSEPVKLNLDITEISLNENSFSLVGPDGLTLGFNDDVPLLGNADISLDGFNFPIGIEVEGNRFKISFGVDVLSGKSTNGSGYKWEVFKDLVSSVQDSTEDVTEELKAYKALFGRDYKTTGKNFDLSLLGYAEGYIVNGEFIFTDCCGELAGKFTFKYTQQGTVWVIPVYGYIKAGASVALQFQAVRHVPDSDVPFDFGWAIELAPEFTLGGGIGVKGALSGGLYGKGSLPIMLNLTENHFVAKLTGELGVEGEFGIWSGKKVLIDGSVVLCDKYYDGTNVTYILARRMNALVSIDSVETETTVISRDYADKTSDWLGNSVYANNFYGSTQSTDNGLSVKDLQTSVYKNSQAELIALNDGRMMMAWIEDNSDRDTYNRLRLVYSIYENGVWGEPKAVSDDGTNDDNPVLATDGETVYIAWQDYTRELTEADADSIDSALTETEVCIAKYNVSEDAFETEKVLTDNNTYEYSLGMVVENSQAVLYWVQNSKNDLTTVGTNTIYKHSTEDDTIETVQEELNRIIDLKCNVESGKPQVSFTMDVDGNVSSEDIGAFTVNNGNLKQFSVESADSIFTVAYGVLDDIDTLFFADNNSISYEQNGEIKTAVTSYGTINGDLQIMNDGVSTILIWSEVSDAGTELWRCKYSNGVWSEPVQITQFGALLHNVSTVYQDGELHALFNRTERTLEENEYVNGQTDYCYMTSADFSDVEASIVYVDESSFVTGETAPISVNLKNNGTTDISNVEITVRDTLGSETTVSKEVSLLSGSETIIEMDYLVPENYAQTTLMVSAVLENTVESDLSNNEDSMEIGYADVSLSDITVNDMGGYFLLNATLKNNNPIIANDVQVNVKSVDTNGTLLERVFIGDMCQGDMYDVQYVIDKAKVEYDELSLGHICFETAITDEEKVVNDNVSYAVLEKNDYDAGFVIESEHNYSNNCNETWTITKKGATAINMTFAESTFIETDGDYIHIYSGDNLFATYTGDELSGKTIMIPGDTVKIQLVSNDKVTCYGFAVTNAEAYFGELPDNLAFKYEVISETDKTARIVEYFDKRTNLTIPSNLDGYTITEIADNAFENCTDLTNITIPSSVVGIGSDAFNNTGYYNDENNWQDNVLYIGNCLIEAKEKVNVAYTVKTGTRVIADSAFDTCTDLISIVIPSSVISIGNDAFENCCNIWHILYSGTETQWNAIMIGSNNNKIIQSVIHYETNGNEVSLEFIKEPSCTEKGYDIYKCSICEEDRFANYVDIVSHSFIDGVCEVCGKSNSFVESKHDYESDCDETWTIYKENAISISVTFSDDTYVEEGYDFIYIYDGNNKLIGEYTGSELASQTITLDGDTVKIRLVTDEDYNYYGFAVVKVIAEYKMLTGDVDGNGKVDVDDYEMIVAVANVLLTLTDEQKQAADINKDGAVDGFDAIYLDLYLNRMITLS